MARNTAKLGGPASDVVIAKVGVSYLIPFTASYPNHTQVSQLTLFIAWTHEDDLDTDTYLG